MNLKDVKAISTPIIEIDGYTRIEYIQGTGTQYFDTGFYPKPTTCVEIDFQFTSIVSQQRLFGTSGNFYFQSYNNGSGAFAFCYNDNSGNWVSAGVSVDTNRHKIKLDGKNKVYIVGDLTLKTLDTTPTNIANYTLCVFATNPSGPLVGTEQKGNFKLYDFKIYDNGTLTKHYVPVIRNSDSKPGVYDLVNNSFTQSASGTFTAGPAITEIKVNKIENSNNEIIWCSEEACPYRLLDYVICDGTAGINTGLQATVKSGGINLFKCKFTPTAVGTQQRILCNYTPSITNTRKYAIIINANTTIQNVIAGNWQGNISAVNNTDYVVESSMLYNNRYITVNGTKLTCPNATDENPVANQMYGFGAGYNYNTSGYYENGFKGKLWGLTTTRNASHSNDWKFLPVQRKSDGKVGFLRLRYIHSTGKVNGIEFMPSEWTTDFQVGTIKNEYFSINLGDIVPTFDWE